VGDCGLCGGAARLASRHGVLVIAAGDHTAAVGNLYRVSTGRRARRNARWAT
jgi:hypothetical protein